MNVKHLTYGALLMTSYNEKDYTDAVEETRRNWSIPIDWSKEEKPTAVQIAEFVCNEYDVPREELKSERQLRYLVTIRKTIAFLILKIHDPDSVDILKHGFYHKKIKKGLRVDVGNVINRFDGTASHTIRGAITEYETDKDVQLLFNFYNHQLFEKYGKATIKKSISVKNAKGRSTRKSGNGSIRGSRTPNAKRNSSKTT